MKSASFLKIMHAGVYSRLRSKRAGKVCTECIAMGIIEVLVVYRDTQDARTPPFHFSWRCQKMPIDFLQSFDQYSQ